MLYTSLVTFQCLYSSKLAIVFEAQKQINYRFSVFTISMEVKIIDYDETYFEEMRDLIRNGEK